jgi:hypothetical protein
MDVNSRRTDKNYAATRLPENRLLVYAQRHVHTHIVYIVTHCNTNYQIFDSNIIL